MREKRIFKSRSADGVLSQCSHSMMAIEAFYKSFQFSVSSEQKTEDTLNHNRSFCVADIEHQAYTK